MVAAAVLKTAVLTDVWVRLPPPARLFLRSKMGDRLIRAREVQPGLKAKLKAK